MSPPRAPTVGITAERRSEEQARMFERLGITAVRGPALSTVMTTGEGPLRAVTEALIAAPPDDLVADTGVGIRSWLGAAADWGLDAALSTTLGAARVLARGPKADGALKSAGLPVAWRAPSETLAEVTDHLIESGVAGRRVAVQLHGEDDGVTRTRLEAAGAEVIDVPVYRWEVPADHAPALALVELAVDGALDALTFTAAPAVHNLFALARQSGLGDAFADAANGRVLIACVGPVCAAAATEEGVIDPKYPEHWRLGSLVKLVAEALSVRD